MLSLYEIDTKLAVINARMDEWAAEHDGDITDFPLLEDLDAFEESKQKKILNLGVWVKNMEASIKAFDNEIKTLAGRKKTLERKADSVKAYMSQSMDAKDKFEDSRCRVSFRKSSYVNIPKELDPEDIERYDKSLVVTKIQKTVDKNGLKAKLKDGPIPIQGTGGIEQKITLETHHNIQIK